MAEISKITLPNGSVYDLKSNVANKFSSNRTIKLTGDVTGSASSNGESGWSIATTVGDDSHNHTTQTIVPRITKSYTGVIASANNDANCHMYYFKVVPDSYAGQWSIKYRVYATIDGVSTGNGSGFEESIVYISGMRNTYSAYRTWNNISNTSYRPYYYHTFYKAKEAGISYGHLLGVSLRYAYNPTTTTNTRNITFEILDYEGCTPTFFDSPIIYANASGTGSTNYEGLTTFDAATAGLTTSGDRNDVNYYNREYYSSRTTKNTLYRYQICVTNSTGQLIPINSVNNSVATNKVLTTDAFDPIGEIFYWASTSTYNAGENIGNGNLYRQYMADLRYSFNCGGYDTTPTLTARLPLYLVASLQTDGTAKLHSSPLSQTLPVSDDGLIYIYLGRVYEDTKPYRVVLSIHHPVYWYKDGAVRQYIQRAENANNAVSATSASKLNSTRSFTIGKTAKNVDWSGAVSFSQAEISDNASTTAAGWMSKDDKVKLNGIETGAQVNTITGVKGNSESSYRTGDVNITATNIGLGNVTNNKQVKGLSSGTTSGHLVTWGSDGYTITDSGIAKGSVATKLALSGTNYSASSNTITVTKANLQSAVQDSSLVLMTAAERTKLASIETDGNYVTIGTEQSITGRKTFSALTSFTNSIKIGSTSQSTGRNSFSQGDYTVASGRISFSQGEYTVASGNNSHAEGDHSIASGHTAHAQGDRTEASNASAHAEGTYSVASGNSSHAQGMHTWAIGNYSHAQGNLTTALGKNSHAGGSFTIATRQDQTVIGRCNNYTGSLQETAPICSDDLFCSNDVIVGGSTADSGDYAFIIGNGQIPFRSNALTVNWSGVTNCFRYESKSSEISLNNTPTKSIFISALKLMDVYGTGYADIGHVYLPDTRRGILMQSSLDGNHDVNALYLLMDSNGNSSVSMTQPQAWRKALGFENKILIDKVVWNGTKITVISCGNLVTLIYWGSENGNWNGGAINAFQTLPVGYRPCIDINQIILDQNSKRIIISAKGNGQVGVYWLLDSITSKTNVYGTISWVAWQ